MTKKILYFILIVTLLNIPIIAKADGDVDGNGTAENWGNTQGAEEGLHIANSNQYGIRITIVDTNGNRISQRSYDYWNGAFDNSTIYQVQGASYKTDIVNRGGISSTDFSPYSFQYSIDNGKNIGGLSRANRHNDIEKIIVKAISGEECQEPAFFKDVGYEICPKLKDNCEELKKTYILIEPLVRMHKVSGGAWYVFSGTEAVSYFSNAYKNGLISLKTYKNNFGGSVYRNLVNMYLSNLGDDSLNYQLKSSSAKYAYFKSNPTSKNITSESQTNLDLFAGKTRDSNGNVWGSSMQLVWLGGKPADYCQSNCCVPCDPNDKECIQKAGDKYDKDDPNCCKADKIEIDGQCKDADEYWDNSDDEHNKEIMCSQCCSTDPKSEYYNPDDPNCCNANQIEIDGQCKDADEYWDNSDDEHNKEIVCNQCCSTDPKSEYYNPKDPNCCYSEQVEIDGQCKDADEYWDDSDDEHNKEIVCKNCCSTDPESEYYDPDDPNCCYADQIELGNKCVDSDKYWEKTEEDTGFTKEDICPNDCCAPCGNPGDVGYENCIAIAGNAYDPEDPYCCYSDKIQMSVLNQDGETYSNVCVDAGSEYWPEHEDLFEANCSPCCIVTEDEDCCDTSEEYICYGGSKFTYSEYWTDDKYNRLCAPNICPSLNINPEVTANACDDENDNNISYFKDPVFNSNGGQFAGFTIEKLEETAKNNNGVLPKEWATKVANEMYDNTFYAVAMADDEKYSTQINSYCTMHCQEIFEVELPDNYPTVNAGRYFTWTIKDSEEYIAKASDAKLCAVDIDLDKAIDDYQYFSAQAANAAAGLANLNCHNKFGVLPVLDGSFGSCSDYASEALVAPYGCTPDSVCIAVEAAGECEICETCCSSYTDDEGTHTSCSSCNCKKYTQYKCATELVGDAARNWYAFVGGTAYAPGCGSTGAYSVTSLLSQCNSAKSIYDQYVTGYSGNVNGIVSKLDECTQPIELEVDMQANLNYQTLFSEENYSTENSDIDKEAGEGSSGGSPSCVDSTGQNLECGNLFTLAHREDGISCISSGKTWDQSRLYASYKGVSGPGYVSPINPNAQEKLYYNSSDVQMLNMNAFSRSGGFVYANPSNRTFNLSKENLWNTIYLSFMSDSAFYKLNQKINACICQDGYVANKNDDGTCSCEKEISYNDFTERFNNYQTLPNGTLSVEFMNGSGYYPIGLTYWNLGSDGHFDSIAGEKDELCDGNVCHYDDDETCRFVINNKIIAEPGDIGECVNPPCDDLGECIVDNKPVANCRKAGGMDVIYRVVDVNNPFPDRQAGSNWIDDVEGEDKQSIITCKDRDSGEYVDGICNNTLHNNGKPLYSFTLTPAAIKEIREDNAKADAGGKVDYATGTVVYPNGETVGGAVSLFMHKYLPGYAESNGGVYDINLDERFSNILSTLDTIKEVNP